jgi:GT2 family glycosyltransferase
MMGESGSPPGLSVVVPTRNVAATIDACLSALLSELSGSPHEIIVVDNGSTDDTLARVRAHPVRLEVMPPAFVAASRNLGARLAAGPLLAFVDSDCVVKPGWSTAVRAVLADAAIGVTGSRHIVRDDSTWVERAWDRAHRRRATAPLVDTAYIPAGNMAVRRDVFLGVGGFDETLETGEDPDLCARIAAGGLRIVEARETRCVHLGEPRTLGDVFRRERWHGRGARLRYGDGRLAPIMISTVGFALTSLVAVAAIVAGLVTGRYLLAAAAVLPALVPAVYALRYARGAPGQGPALYAIYAAYFVGRAAALPVVAARAWHRARVAPEEAA